MKIVILAAGAAGMICGSCLRDNALALALRKLGHDAMLVPLYTQLRIDGEQAETGEVFYGGINVWLQHASAVFRWTPRFLDWVWDRPGLLKMAGNMGAGTSPATLAGMTKGMLRGEAGGMGKELGRLVGMLKELKPEVVSLPNLMFVGIAQTLARETGAKIVVELTGEDIFLEGMGEADQRAVRELVRAGAGHVSSFVATSKHYAGKMAGHLGVEAERVAVVYPGVGEAMMKGARAGGGVAGRVGHMARIDPAKGLDLAMEAVDKARELGAAGAELHYAGWEGGQHKKWHEAVRAKHRNAGVYHGEVEFDEKVKLLDSVEVVVASARYPEAKGLYVIEAMARGRPVVAWRAGCYAELVEETGAGVVVEFGDVAALGRAVAGLLRDEGRRREMGEKGMRAVRERFSDGVMARGMVEVYGGG